MLLKSFHRYLGLVLALIMLSISVTGVLLLWKKEYLWLTIPDARQAIDPQTLPAAIARIENNYADGEVLFVQLYSEDLNIHKVFLSGKRYAWHNQQGQAIQTWKSNERFEDWLLDLHHRFLLGNTIGLNIAGFGGLLLIPLLVCGLLIWWPRRRLFKVSLWPSSYQRGSLLRSHGNSGAMFALPIFVLTLTGVVLVYPTESRMLLINGFGDEVPAKLEEKNYTQVAEAPAWSELIAIAQQQFPESSIRSIQPASSESSVRVINLQQAREWHRLGQTSIRFENAGTMVIKDAFQQPLKRRILAFSYPLHTAKLGLLYKLFLTLVGLGLALLCVLGLISYAKSLFVQGQRPV